MPSQPMQRDDLPDELNRITGEIVDAIGCVRKELGAGLVEKAYEGPLEQELRSRGLDVQRQLEIPLSYKGRMLDEVFRVDLLVEKRVILELKSSYELHPFHFAQLLSYLRHAAP